MPHVPLLTVVTYNVFGGGKFSSFRHSAIVDTILGLHDTPATAPDIICLQEATEEIIFALQNALGSEYYVFTKLEYLCQPELPIEHANIARKAGFLAILSRFQITSRHVLHKGFCPHDGILKCSVLVPVPNGLVSATSDSSPSSVPLTIYCYHGSGGTFNKTKQALLKRRTQRIEELDVLREDMKKELARHDFPNGASPTTIIAGDFNSDCNDPEMFPDTSGYPEKVLDKSTLSIEAASKFAEVCCYDVWMAVHKSPIGSQTESHKYNTFRAWLKPSQKREATFDKVVIAYSHGCNGDYIAVDPISIDVIGNRKCNTLVVDSHRNVVTDGNVSDDRVDLFPSDHFGLKVCLSAHSVR